MQTRSNSTLSSAVQPVLLTLPRSLPRRERVSRFRALGQAALEQASRAAGAEAMVFKRDEDGAPIPDGDWHWSLTNAEGLVAAVVANVQVGIDAEPLDRPRRDTLFAYLTERDPEGLARLGGDGDAALIQWTAFEAALKLLGQGVSGLPRTTLELSQGDPQEGWHLVRVGQRCLPVWSQTRMDHVLSVALDVPAEHLPRVLPISASSEGVNRGAGAQGVAPDSSSPIGNTTPKLVSP